MSQIGFYYGVSPATMRRQYKKHSSGFEQWDQLSHANEYLLFEDNVGKYLSIDEVALSHGELYTFVTNKEGKGKSGTLVACIKGTRSEDIKRVLNKLPRYLRKRVKEVTMDMAKNMEAAVRSVFTRANCVTDRFHVVRMVLEAVQHIRVNHRWAEADIENNAIAEAKKQGLRYKPIVLSNGDTPKQLLARPRYLLAKKPYQWTHNQKQRARLLFMRYQDLQAAYRHATQLRTIYEVKEKHIAEQKLLGWVLRCETLFVKEFESAANTITNNIINILNFFDRRSTNANAESFNAKVKLFRANLRGVTDPKFFLFRLSKLFA